MNSWAALGARKAEAKRPFRSEDRRASIEESSFVSALGQGGLLCGPRFGRFYMTFSFFSFLRLAIMKQSASNLEILLEQELDRKHDTKN